MSAQVITAVPVAARQIQTSQPYHCWECSAPDLGGSFLLINHSPLQAFADHIYYMRLYCGHNPRCVRLGDTIAPLPPLDRSIEENLASIQESLAYLAKVLPPEKQTHDPISHTVYLLVAGRISPQTAINQLRGPLNTRVYHH